MAGIDEEDFKEERVRSWEGLMREIQKLDEGKWMYRGQTSDWALESKFERTLNDFGIDLKDAPKIERELIREFQRHYDGVDRDLVIKNTLYCLALMQHHGAPTRLLDCTYSPYVAAYFALESIPKKVRSDGKKPASVIWCFNQVWCDKTAIKTLKGKKKGLLKRRYEPDTSDKARNDDKNFKALYMPKRGDQKFAWPENPIMLNQRLIVQRGVFLCPGKVSESFEANVKELDGWHRKTSILKLRLQFKDYVTERKKALQNLFFMNVDRATLFQGLDGFAQSLPLRLPYFHER